MNYTELKRSFIELTETHEDQYFLLFFQRAATFKGQQSLRLSGQNPRITCLISSKRPLRPLFVRQTLGQVAFKILLSSHIQRNIRLNHDNRIFIARALKIFPIYRENWKKKKPQKDNTNVALAKCTMRKEESLQQTITEQTQRCLAFAFYQTSGL